MIERASGDLIGDAGVVPSDPAGLEGMSIGTPGQFGSSWHALLAMLEAGEPLTPAWLREGRWEVDIAAKRYPAQVSLKPLYDPTMLDLDVSAIHAGFLRGARAAGAALRTDAALVGAAAVGGGWRLQLRDGEIGCNVLVNASGAWAAQIVKMAGIEGVGVIPGKGIMIAMNHRLVNTVINRCTMPADGDILVPIRTVSVIGTTDSRSLDPDEIPVTQDEVDQMLDDGERLVPGFREASALRVWAGVRPLFQDARAGEVKDTRDVSRTHAVVDHRGRDGIDGLLTMSGGKLTTLRLMAQDLVYAMCDQLGEVRPCRTHEERPPDNEDAEHYTLGSRLRRREATLQDEQLICECELIGRSRLEQAMRRRGSANLDDIRRSMRLGMGPCQGGFCIYRATGILHGVGHLDGAEAAESLLGFLQERWKGVWPILYGDQLRQARLDDWIFQGLLDVEHLPGGEAPE